LVRGSIRLKGARKRPWLEICRPETERAQLSWQLRCLQDLHDGPLEYVKDRVPSTGFYDIHRLRVHGEGLYRVYELLYPRDTWTLTPELLEMAGDLALAQLWSDAGKWSSRRLAFSSPSVLRDDWLVYDAWFQSRGYQPKVWWTHGIPCRIWLAAADSAAYKQAATPYLHHAQRRRLLSPTEWALS
jgi:hypothetical protein